MFGTTFDTGVFNLEARDVPGGQVRELRAFCIDLKQAAPMAWTAYDDVSLDMGPKPYGAAEAYPMGMVRAMEIMELWGRNYASVDTDVEAAAFQIAIWEIIFDDGADILSGDIQIVVATGDPGTAAALAQTWVDALDGTGPMNFGLRALVNDDYQGFVYDGEEGATSPIPEPLTMATALIGLCGLGSYVRRRTVA